MLQQTSVSSVIASLLLMACADTNPVAISLGPLAARQILAAPGGPVWHPTRHGPALSSDRLAGFDAHGRQVRDLAAFDLLAVGDDGTLYGRDGAFLVAVDPDTEERLWFNERGLGASAREPLAIAVRQDGWVFSTDSDDPTAADSYLVAIAPNGATRWSASIPGRAGAPVIASDGTIVVPSQPLDAPGDTPTSLHGIAPDGARIWTRELPGTLTGLACSDDGAIFATASRVTPGAQGILLHIPPGGGSEGLWSMQLQLSDGTPLTVGSPVLDADGRLFVGTIRGWLAVDTTSNPPQILWHSMATPQSTLNPDLGGGEVTLGNDGRLHVARRETYLSLSRDERPTNERFFRNMNGLAGAPLIAEGLAWYAGSFYTLNTIPGADGSPGGVTQGFDAFINAVPVAADGPLRKSPWSGPG